MVVVNYIGVLFIIFNGTSSHEIRLKAEIYASYQNKVEEVGAISKTKTSSLMNCARDCAINDKCLTFFFNTGNRQCVIHSKYFFNQTQIKEENGWTHYIAKDRITCENKIKEVAHKKPTGQSSTYMEISDRLSEYGVDGNISTIFHTEYEIMPYWWVDLQNSFHVNHVEIWNRMDGSGFRLRELDITIGQSLQNMTFCAHYKGPSKTGDQFVLTCKGTNVGRFVKLTLNVNETTYFHLSEVKVFAYDNC